MPFPHQDQKYVENWNLRWFEAISSKPEQNRIDISHQFAMFCNKVVEEIVSEWHKMKRDRKYVPVILNLR